MQITPQHLAASLAELSRALTDAGVPFAVAGGHAVAIHGTPRATKDIDILTRAESRTAADRVMRSLGYRLEQEHGGFALYVRPLLPDLPELVERVDLLFSSRPLGRRAIDEAAKQPEQWRGTPVPVVPVGVLIVMKLMALVDDPDRPYDAGDVQNLLLLYRGRIDVDQLRRDADSVGADVRQRLEAFLAQAGAREDTVPYAATDLRI
jgi:hypothetical protein